MYTLSILFVLVLLAAWRVWHRRRTGNPVSNDWNRRFWLKSLLGLGLMSLLIWLVPDQWAPLVIAMLVCLALVEEASKRSRLFNRGEQGESGHE
jgi:hypothetical protein